MPSVPPKAGLEPRAPERGDSRVLGLHTSVLPGLSACPKSPRLGALWARDARATRLPCASRDARQSRRSEERCRVKGRDVQCPGLGPHPTVSPRWLPCGGAGWSLHPHLQAPGPARGSGVPGCLLAGVPAEEDPQRGEGPKKGWARVLGAPACRGRTGGWGSGARPVCRGRGWLCPCGLGAPTVVPGLGSVQARRTCPSSGPLFRVWAPSGLSSTRPDSVSVPAAHGCPRGSRSTNLYGPPRRSLWGAGSPRGVGGEA